MKRSSPHGQELRRAVVEPAAMDYCVNGHVTAWMVGGRSGPARDAAPLLPRDLRVVRSPIVSPSDDYAESVLSLVERIPAGRVMTYGGIAEYLGAGGPRQVGSVMSHYGGPVPWHRVVNASGRVVPGHEQEALRRLREEGTPLRGDRVNLREALWWPDESDG